MSITAECNVCGKKYEAPDHLAGKRVRCKQCGNIFELGGGPEGGPDLNALAEMERSYHSLDATAAGQHPDAEQSDDPDHESPKPLRTGRTNVRFAFPMAKEIDTWAPLVLTLGGLAWLASYIFHYDPAPPRWLEGIWLIVALFSYWVIICPIALSLLRSAGRSQGYQMPVNDRRRAFAAFLPPFALAYVLWATGEGKLIAVILGCVCAIAVASATVWLLFRLRTHEIAPTALYTGVGFIVGILIAGGIFYGINLLTVNALVASKKPDVLSASPFGPGFDWISAEDVQRIHAELAVQAHPATAPSNPKPEPPAPTPPPQLTSPIVRSSQVAPITGGFTDVIRPLVDSHSLATVRRGSDNNSIALEVWDTDSWKSLGSSTFDTRSEVGRRRVLSPDGKLLARIVSFPSLSVQVSSFADARVNNVYFTENLGTPELVGFLGDAQLLVLWQKPQGPSALEIINISTRARVALGSNIPAFTLGESTLAVSNDGTTAAVAAKFNNLPTILVFNLQTGVRQATVTITSLDPRWPVAPTGFDFSPDKKQLAILFEQSGSALLQRYEFSPDKATLNLRLEQVYPAGPIRGGSPRQYSGSALAWLPDSNGWIIYGQAAFSAASGQPFAELGVTDIASCHVLAPDIAQLISSSGSGATATKQITVLHLDTAKIASMIK